MNKNNIISQPLSEQALKCYPPSMQPTLFWKHFFKENKNQCDVKKSDFADSGFSLRLSAFVVISVLLSNIAARALVNKR